MSRCYSYVAVVAAHDRVVVRREEHRLHPPELLRLGAGPTDKGVHLGVFPPAFADASRQAIVEQESNVGRLKVLIDPCIIIQQDNFIDHIEDTNALHRRRST